MPNGVSVEYNGRVAIITLDDQKKLNALSKDGFYQLAKYMREISTHDEVFVTLLIGRGRFFSAGADVSISRQVAPDVDVFRHGLRETVANNLNITNAFYSHPKILVTALNGPAVGLSAALISFSDFIYCVPSTFILTPFSSLGLVAEGGASHGFVQRMGIARANEALIMSKRIPAEELIACSFVNKIFDCAKGEDERFRKLVLNEIEERLGPHLIGSSMLNIKSLIRLPERRDLDAQNVAELFEGLKRQIDGIPQREFEKMRSGQKRHKL